MDAPRGPHPSRLRRLGGRVMKAMKKFLMGWLMLATLPAAAQTVEYIHTDALGTPIAVTDANRVVVERSEYEPYGKLLNRPLTDGPSFTGHVQDAATGLTYMQQRYYDPMIGRFLSADPVATRPMGDNFNRYWYANNNPYKSTDPDGRETIDCRGSKTCAAEIRVADLKKGDIVKTDRATVRVGRHSGNLSVTFTNVYGNGSSAAQSGPRIVPTGPAKEDTNANMKTAGGLGPVGFYEKVRNKGDWDYKQQGEQYEEYGNFNYGAAGRGHGFRGTILLQEAGKAQGKAGTSDPSWGSPGVRFYPHTGTGSFGDDPVDQYWIQQGIRYHDETK